MNVLFHAIWSTAVEVHAKFVFVCSGKMWCLVVFVMDFDPFSGSFGRIHDLDRLPIYDSNCEYCKF